MIPLRDVIPSRTTPWITCLLIVVNALVFAGELLLDDDEASAFFMTFGLVPAELNWISAFTAIFIHAGWIHVGGNLLALWLFGDNVEDRMGHGRFLAFYLLAGLAGNLTHVLAMPASTLPLVGASGAIAGIMGAYLVLFPYSRVLVLVFLVIFIDVVEIPAVFLLAFWFLLQLISGVDQLSGVFGTGIRLWAHIGGFVAGALGVRVFTRPERQKVEWWEGEVGIEK